QVPEADRCRGREPMVIADPAAEPDDLLGPVEPGHVPPPLVPGPPGAKRLGLLLDRSGVRHVCASARVLDRENEDLPAAPRGRERAAAPAGPGAPSATYVFEWPFNHRMHPDRPRPSRSNGAGVTRRTAGHPAFSRATRKRGTPAIHVSPAST